MIFAARPRDQLDARRHFRRKLVFDSGIQVLFVFAHDHHVHIRVLRLDERVIGDARPHVGILAKGLARGDVQALEAAALRVVMGALRKTLVRRRDSQELGSMPDVLPRK